MDTSEPRTTQDMMVDVLCHANAARVSVLESGEADEIACAWSDYRSDYGASGSQEHKAFRAGWLAARAGDQSAVLR